jgi:hypothetical protein
MKNINTFEKTSSFFELYQLLQTINKEFFANNQVIDKFNQKEASLCMK